MAYSSVASKAYDCESSSGRGRTRGIVAGIALAIVALACAWSVCSNFFAAPRVEPLVILQKTVRVLPKGAKEQVDPGLYRALFDINYGGGLPPTAFAEAMNYPPANFARNAPQIVADLPVTDVPRRLVQTIPMPAPRPAELRAPQGQNASLHARAQRNKAVADTADDKPSIFERLFGKPQTSGQSLAYAAPDGGVSGDGQSLMPGRGRYDRQTAVYDISAHTVYMPDGTALEAHSGLGHRLDDPHHVHERMWGATPPHVYDLEMRAGLFHGVRALRLIPVDGDNPFGRTGLLAHTYMLGPNGDSNGCVSFRNYEAFLRAYLNNEVKRLVVVARVS